ncbi:MAG: Imm27 family immunity protein [Bacteroidota bacterium]
MKDPYDNRYWELSYPQGNLHGGGPPSLINLDKDYIVKEYGEIPDESTR